jgi:hypothetical protein
MAGTARTLYITGATAVTADSFFSRLQDGGVAPTAANSVYGWTVAKTATTTPYWKAFLGATAVSTAASATSTIDSTSPTAGTGSGATTAGNAFVAGPYKGTFANTAWTFALNMRASVAGAIGNMRMRVFKSSNRNGSSSTALTGSTLVTSTPKTLSTSADVDAGFTWSPGAITLSNEFLFFEPEWQETTAGSSTTSNVLFRVGTATITTPVLTYSDPYSMPSVKAWFDPKQNVTLASGKVSSWTDVVNGLAATQATTANQPPFSTTAMNDFPGLSMTRTAEWSLSVGSTLGGTPSTLIAICNPEYLLGTGLTIFGPDGTQSTQFRVKDGGLLNIVKSGVVEIGTSTSAIAQGQYAIVVFTLDASTYSLAINGTGVGSGANSAGAIAAAASHFFSNQTSLTGEEYSGLMGDIIMTSIVSASADIQIAEGYLAWKYNLVQVLPTAHPFKLAPPSGPTPFLVPPRKSIVTNRRM